jgi:hypothetical protein
VECLRAACACELTSGGTGIERMRSDILPQFDCRVARALVCSMPLSSLTTFLQLSIMSLRMGSRHHRSEAPWLGPAVCITAAVYLAGLLLLPLSKLSAALPVGKFVTGWLYLMAIVAAIGLLALVIKLAARRERRPLGSIREWLGGNQDLLVSTAIGLGLVGLMSMGFGWVKTQLDYAAPFWADRMWADMDRAIFGVDPYIPLRMVLGRGIFVVDLVYSLWYPATVLALSGVFLRRRSAAIIAYFLLWGVFGLAIQALGSSAGPIFWERIGLGDRFADIVQGVPPGSALASNYLWHVYVQGSSQIASGISAMPSLHVGMGAWIAIAYLRTPYAPLGLLYWACVFVGSIALGWHYFMDGVVGSASTVVAFALARFYLGWAAARAPVGQAALPGVVAVECPRPYA